MSRRMAREIALQTLFQLDYNKDIDCDKALEIVFSEHEDITLKAKEYSESLVVGTKNNNAKIDDMISELSTDWKLERMSGVDRNILRIAIYEMLFGSEKLPPNVVINEAVELAKKYGEQESGKFINGILGTIVRNKD